MRSTVVLFAMETMPSLRLGARPLVGGLVRARAVHLCRPRGGCPGKIEAEEEEEIEEVLEDPQLMEDVTAALEEVRGATKDIDLMRQEAEDLTKRQDAKVKEAKVWRRKVVARAKRAARRGVDVPTELLTIGRATSVPDIVAQLTTMLALFEAQLADMGGARAQALLAEGQAILSGLSSADAEQEVARLASLPEKYIKFYAAKGRLYLGIKLINDGGQELHADDLAKAAKYNLKILHRRGKTRSGGGGGGGGPTGPA